MNLNDVVQSTDYPVEAARAGISEGQAVVSFTARSDGATRNAKVVSATNPLFEQAALSVVNRMRCDRWHYDRKARLPINFRLPVKFAGAGEKPREGCTPTEASILEISKAARQAGLNKGTAKVEFILTPDGRVTNAKVIEASSDAFATSAQRYVETFACSGTGAEVRVVVPLEFRLE